MRTLATLLATALLLAAAVACSHPAMRGGSSESDTPRGSRPASPQDAGSDAVVALVNHSAPHDDLMGSYSCAGVVVAPRYVLTAGHCVRARTAASVDVVVGAGNLCKGEPVPGRRIRVTGVVTFAHRDLALLRLGSETRVATTILGAEPLGGAKPAAHLTAVGWGRLGPQSPNSCRKRGVALRTVSGAACAAMLAHDPRYAPAFELCARPEDRDGVNTCVGDSGGPLLEGPRQSRVVAVTSWGLDCAPGSPGAYAGVAGIGRWLARHRRPRCSEGTVGYVGDECLHLLVLDVERHR